MPKMYKATGTVTVLFFEESPNKVVAKDFLVEEVETNGFQPQEIEVAEVKCPAEVPKEWRSGAIPWNGEKYGLDEEMTTQQFFETIMNSDNEERLKIKEKIRGLEEQRDSLLRMLEEIK